MARYRILAWREIPVAVEVQDAAEQVTLPLSDRFQQLVDAAAVQLGLDEADAYLEQWRHLEAEERPGTAREVG
ncbi:MAG TPA: virulence factor, partial [Methylomirabilota bacterium]|nr:virulence factor [Methylomirabilota bacterium]